MCNREHAASEIVAAQKCSVFEFFYVYWRVGSLLDLGGELVGLPSVASAGGGAGGILEVRFWRRLNQLELRMCFVSRWVCQ